LTQLALLNSGAIPSPLTGKLDLTRVGVYGHSTGGGATVVMCAADPRCKAALGMDPWVGPVPRPVLDAGLRQPFLAMMSQTWSSPDNSALLDTLLAAGTGDQMTMTIAGTSHYDFTMLPLLTPLAPALGLKGPIDGQRGMQIITDHLVAFFDHYLKGVRRGEPGGLSRDHVRASVGADHRAVVGDQAGATRPRPAGRARGPVVPGAHRDAKPASSRR